MSLLFAPRATAHLTRDFFPGGQSRHRGFFIGGSPLVWLVFFWLYALLAVLVVVVWLTLVVVVWAAQLIWLVLAGPAVLIRRRTHPPVEPPAPRFAQREAGQL